MALAACGGSVGDSAGSGGSAAGSSGSSAAGSDTGGSSAGTAGTAGTAGPGGSNAGTAGAAGTMTGGSGAGGSSAGGSGGSGAGMCQPCEWSCCGDSCTNLENDFLNCGACGNICPGPDPYCDNGVCAPTPCNGALCGPAGLCCGAQCCMAGEICCDVPGPVEQGPTCTMPNEAGTCPLGCASCVCASPDSPIATPDGERPIRDLAAGDLVYSVHRGQVVAVPIALAVHVPAPNHTIVEITLENGRVIEMSPKHPTADGRTFADLRAGASLAGVVITAARMKPFAFVETYDILPDSDTGTYFAAGALVGSTLAPNAAQHCGQATTPLASLQSPAGTVNRK